MTSFANGMKGGSFAIKLAFLVALLSAVSNAKNYYNNFYDAGSHVAQGFADGIKYNAYKAEAQARIMAQKAATAAEKALKINSPSKVFRGIAYSIPEGFAQGIDRKGWMVENSATSMAEMAVENTKNIISSIANVIGSDIDSQPTIRPVLDLSDVESGSSLISSMLNGGILSVDTRRANSISAYMSGYQNGGNSDELLSAIKGLRKDISSMPRNSYNINGITYDDGSNISDAVQTLVRAARIERRT